jgi:glutamyl-tRNA synthetase
VIRAVEHLSNTPRQIFIMQSLGYPLPEFAHLPYVAEPGSSNKLSKRKIAQYLKHADFKKLQDHALGIAQAIGHSTAAETFNPVIVDFYRVAGYLPDAILNYLLLLGWAYDDSKEDFTREEMIRLFSLERVNKAPASFDPKKLWAFQDRHMRAVPVKQKTPMAIRYLQQAGWAGKPTPCELGGLVQSILEAAGDRFKTAGDILQFHEFFVADDVLAYDEKEFDKQVRSAAAVELLGKFRERLAAVPTYTAEALEDMLKAFVAEQNIKLGQLIHPLRIALTGKTVGIGLYETLVILGQTRCLARIDRALARVA